MTRVQLAVSQIAGVPGVGAAYHTSVLVDGVEFYFSDTGLMRVPPPDDDGSEVFSHAAIGSPTQVFEMGTSCRQERHLAKVLSPHFRPGTYDFLRKNCNSFSDCALTYLLGRRLDARFRQMDLLASGVLSSLPLFLPAALMGYCSPNPAADGFDFESMVHTLATRSQPSAIDWRAFFRRTTLNLQGTDSDSPSRRKRARRPSLAFYYADNCIDNETPSSPQSALETPSSPPELSSEALKLVFWMFEEAAEVPNDAFELMSWLTDGAAEAIHGLVKDVQMYCSPQVCTFELDGPAQSCN